MSSEDELQRIITEGVTVPWLSQAFGLNGNTIRSRLAACPTIGKIGNANAYSLADAAPYLVKSRTDVESFLQKVKIDDFPLKLRKEYWEAKKKEQDFLKEARELWHTSDVIDAVTGIFLAVKLTVQLWPDMVERQIGLTNEQRELLVDMGDRLLGSIHEEVLSRVRDKSTGPALKELEEVEDDWPI